MLSRRHLFAALLALPGIRMLGRKEESATKAGPYADPFSVEVGPVAWAHNGRVYKMPTSSIKLLPGWNHLPNGQRVFVNG